MKRHYVWFIVALILFLGGVGQPSAHADSYVFRINDLSEGSLTIQFLKNGNIVTGLCGPFVQAGESVINLPLVITSACIPAVSIVDSAKELRANILEPDNPFEVSDTYFVTTDGPTEFSITFMSDTEGGPPLVPLTNPNAGPIFENGLFQSIGTYNLSDGSTIDFQFLSAPGEIPEPSTFVLVSLGGLGLLAYRYRYPKPGHNLTQRISDSR
jgi:hypothetical protein